MKAILPLCLALMSAVGHAAPAPLQPTQQRVLPPMRKYPGVSDAGNAILADALQAPDPQLSQIVQQQRQSHDQLAQVAMAPSVDLDRVAALIRQRDDLQTQFRARADERLIGAMGQLPIIDRGPFLRALLTPQPPR